MANKRVSKPAQSIRSDALNVTLTGERRLHIETAAGQKITIHADDQSVIIQDASGDSIQLQGGNIQIRAAAQVSIQCSAVNLSASTITFDAPTTKFTGQIQADTVITNTVIANTYTPGVGNIW